MNYNPPYYASESDFYPVFEKWLQDSFTFKGFNGLTFSNVFFSKVSGIRELDVVGIYRWNRSKRYVLTSVEVKLNKFSEALQQAQARLCLFDYCYCAFPITVFIGEVLHDFASSYSVVKEAGIGVLIYDPARTKIWEVLNPRKSKLISQKYRTQLLEKLNGLSSGKLHNLESFLKPTIEPQGNFDIEELINNEKQKK